MQLTTTPHTRNYHITKQQEEEEEGKMEPATDPPPEPPPPPAETLSQITNLLNHLLPATHTVTSFTARWLTLRSKLTSLKLLLSEILASSSSSNPPWFHNPLLPTILHNLLQTLSRIQTLHHHCSPNPQTPTPGKLLMQSDLDIAANWLSSHAHHLNLLLSSGVLHHHHSTAIVRCRPDLTSSDEHLSSFLKDLFTRLQIGGMDFKLQALQTLVQLLVDGDVHRCAAIVAKEVKLGCLISLLDAHSDDSVRELAVHAVALLVSCGDSPRKCVFEEGCVAPLLRMMADTTCSVPMRERATNAVEFITSDVDNAWAVSAYGGVPVLIEVCRSGSVAAQSHAVGAIRNVCGVEDIRVSLVEEGVVPVLMRLIESGSASAQGKAVSCMAILTSSGECFRRLLLRERVLQGLLRLFHDECPVGGTVEHVLCAVHSFSESDAGCRILSGSSVFLVQLSEIVKHGNVRLQHIAVSLLARLLISDGSKVAIGGCMSSLVKLMESVTPDGLQEVAARLLVVLLSVKSNRTYFVRDEKSLMRLVKMLDPRNVIVSKKFPVAVVAALVAGGSQRCRKRLVEGGALVHLQRLAEMDVMGAQKALQRLSGNRLASIFARTWRE